MLWYLFLPLTVSSLHTGGFGRSHSTFLAATSLETSNVVDSSTTTREQRAERAKKTWSTIALQPTRDESETISLQESSEIYDAARFKEFCNVKGTFFINGLGSCQIGDRLMHPFEAHGLVKSLAFDGQGSLFFTKRLVQTELTEKEVSQNRPLARGVMSTVAELTFPWSLVNMMSPSDRDTANLVAHLWPPPGKSPQEPLLITCTDNGEPHALDPKTLETKGKLVHFLPMELKNRLDGKKLLAHTRVDEDRERMVLCINTMEIPGESNEGNSTMEFIEVDTEWNIVSSRSFTTRFMVFHDWVMTENYYVVPKNPAVLKWGDLAKFLVGTTTGTSIFAMDEACPGELILIPRHDENAPVLEVKDDEFFNIFHFGPAYEENGELVVHSSSFDQYKFGREMGFDGPTQTFDPIAWGASGDAPPPRLDKFVVDLGNKFHGQASIAHCSW